MKGKPKQTTGFTWSIFGPPMTLENIERYGHPQYKQALKRLKELRKIDAERNKRHK